MGQIREKLEKIWAEQRELEKQAKALQEQCEHPSFTEGLTIIACIQPILICDECGFGKPIKYDSGNGNIVSTYGC